MKFIYEGVNPEEVITKAKDIISNVPTNLSAYCFVTNYIVGDDKNYLSSIFTAEDIDHLNTGESVLIASPTGSGKTKAIQEMVKSVRKGKSVIILTNRRGCKTQLVKDLCNSYGLKDIPSELSDKITLDENVKVMCYQEFVNNRYKYHGKKILLILDECHFFAEDSTFSNCPQKILDFLLVNLDNTIRIYITATPDDIINTIWELESLSNHKLTEVTSNTKEQDLLNAVGNTKTRIRCIYIMKANWDYLTFKSYDPRDTETLLEYIKTANKDGKKSLIYINDIEKGRLMQETMDNSQHIYSDEDKKLELRQIALNEQFSSDTLITTKVAENGLSLHDDKLSIIVAETWDLICLQQVIGRARVNRNNPRNIEVLIPDYSASDLGTIYSKIYNQLKEAKKAAENPHFALEYNKAFVSYSAIEQKLIVNNIGIQTLEKQLDFISTLKEKEKEITHAFIRKVLQIYGKNTDITDNIFINYNCISDCKQRILSAWENFKNSERDENALKILKEELKEACNKTKAYPKELRSNIQLETINEILKFADIDEALGKGRKIFDIA